MSRTRRPLHLVFYPLFFLSGASSLIFETLWQRKMTHVFGASAPSITAILTAFFLGMAFGSWWGGKLLDRLQGRISTPRFYAFTEIWIGAFGVSVPLLLRAVDHLYVWLFSSYDPDPAFSLLYRFVMCVAVALPASLGMGATVPTMARLISEYGLSIGRSVGVAYGVNTLGAVSGCLATGFVLLEVLGIQNSLFFASALNAIVVVASLAVSLTGTGTASMEEGAGPVAQALDRRRVLLLVLYFATSFVAIGLEVTWMRMLAIFTFNDLTTFVTGLSVYLTGFSLGSLLLYPILERRCSGLAIFFVSSIGVTLSCLLLLPNAPEMHRGLLRLWEVLPLRPARWAYSSRDFAEAATLMLLPSVLMGLAFPAACQAITESRSRIALRSGFIYFVGNLGSTAGGFAAGLVLIPALSLHGTWALLAGLDAVVAALAISLLDVPRRAAWAATALALLVPCALLGSSEEPIVGRGRVVREGDAWQLLDGRGRPTGERIISHRTGVSATVTVREEAEPATGRPLRSILIDDQVVASTKRFSKVDSKMLAHLPLLLHPEPRTALTVGFGSGGTSWSMTLHGVQTDVVEIEPEVIRAAPLFESQNHGVLESPLLQVVLNDARNHLYVTRKKYDVIATDVTNLKYKQNGSLYTRDYFELMKARLTERGIACAWIPLGITDFELATLLATFGSVFPHASLWYMDQTPTTFGILIGTPAPVTFDYERMQRGFAIEAVRRDLAEIGLFHPLHLIHLMYLDEEDYRRFVGPRVRLHTDDHPILEFRSPADFAPQVLFRRAVLRLLAMRPHSLEHRIANLDASELGLLRRYERFAQAWGAFVHHSHLNPSGIRDRAEFYRRGVELIEEALRAVPDYRPARRKLREFRRKLEAATAA